MTAGPDSQSGESRSGWKSIRGFVALAVVATAAGTVAFSQVVSSSFVQLGAGLLLAVLAYVAFPSISGWFGAAGSDEAGSGLVQSELPKVVAAARQVADGNLTAKVEVAVPAGLESSAVAASLLDVDAAFGEMTEELATIVGTAGEISRRVQDGSDRLAQASSESTQAASDVASAIGSVAEGAVTQAAVTAQVAESVAGIRDAVASASDAVASVSDISSKAKENAGVGRTQLDDATEAMDRITSSFGQVADTVDALGERSEKVEEIVDLIRSIAEQTNLLALNAAIEAARAGDAGRGFAVVASEVKALAEESASSTEEIAALVTAMRESAERARSATDTGRADVTSGASTIHGASVAFGSIAESVDAMEAQVHGAVAAVERIDAATGSISAGVEELESVAESSSAVAEEVAASAEEMAATGSEIDGTASDLAKSANELAAALRGFTFGDASLDFASAISAHRAWKTRLSNFLKGTEELHHEDIASHRECELGRWLYGSGMAAYGHLPEMDSLERDHQTLHGKIKAVVEAHNANDKARAESAFSDLLQLSDRVVADLETLQDKS